MDALTAAFAASAASSAAFAASAAAPPPLILAPCYKPPTDPGAMAPRIEGDVKVICICGEPAEDESPYCSFGCECHARYLEETGYLASERREEIAQAAKKKAAEDICHCGKPAEDGLPYCSLACECQAKYEEDEEWQQALEAKAKAQKAQNGEGH